MSQPIAAIVVPGSTSNLGPGFDTLSVALGVFLRVEVLDVLPARPDTLATAFGGPAPAGENRIETAFRFARQRLGVSTPGLRIRAVSEIPMAAGLGSSAAASVAGLRLYEAAAGLTLDDTDLLTMASELDGHPDNAAAALLGGMTVSCQRRNGRILARSWPWPEDIRFIVATPDFTLHTSNARAVLPESVPLADAVANLQRAVLLIRAIETAQYDDIREALHDRWHQPPRAALVPGLAESLAIEHPAVLGVCLSGAGPSVVALAAPGRADEAATVLGAVYDRLGLAHTLRNLAAHRDATARLPASLTERETTA